MKTPELLLLGGPNSGKTHYAGQLYGRLRRRPGLLRLRESVGTPSDLTVLQEVLGCLENGHTADHTSAETFAEVSLPLIDSKGRSINLRWPDYGGEQLSSVVDQRAVPDSWRARLQRADCWVLLIRLHIETTYPEALQQLVHRASEGNGDEAPRSSWDANARWVELLQILLHVAGIGTVAGIRAPRLAVLLSCYDELSREERSPWQALAERLPMLSSFIDVNWLPEARSVWGLSALGKALDKESADECFLDKGPEHQGWVVGPEGGAADPDLTRPLSWLLETL